MRGPVNKTHQALRRQLLAGPLLTLFCAALLCSGCNSVQRKLLYFPTVYTAGEAEAVARTNHLERWQAPDGQPVGWKRLTQKRPLKGQVLLIHGNGGCACELGHYADAIQGAGAYDFYIVEFPGYGDRPGEPTEQTLEAASAEAFQLLAPKKRPTYLVGESLGTGVAAYVAGRFPKQVAGLAMLAPYNRLTDVAQWRVPFVDMEENLADKYPAEDYLRNYRGPMAVVVAGHDSALPERFGFRLYARYKGPKRIWVFPDGDHVTTQTQPAEFWKEIEQFWQKGE